MGEALLRRLNKEIDIDPFPYDLVDYNEYDEIDLLYTADVHGAWIGYYPDEANYSDSVFGYSDLSDYRSTLANNNIKALLVDAGDWSHPCHVYNDYINTGRMMSAEAMNDAEYFAVTYGNHEWKWDVNYGKSVEPIFSQCNNLIACNMFKNGQLMYPAYKTAKIGSKKLAIIGVGYPSPNGGGSYSNNKWTYGDYTFYDSSRLFSTVQSHIDYFKNNEFDYIIAICHMCHTSYESDSRYYARSDTLIKNTTGLTAVIQAHYNFTKNAQTIADKGGNGVLLCHESEANLHNFGRLKLPKNGTISSYLVDERSDLSVV